MTVGQTHCKRGHPLSGENLYLPRSGMRNCRICRKLWRQENLEKRRGYLKRARQKNRVYCGYTRHVVTNVGIETLTAAIAAIRETGRRSAAHSIIKPFKFKAILHFEPKLAKAVKRLTLKPAPLCLTRSTARSFVNGPTQEMARIMAAVPNRLPRDMRDDVIAEITLALYEGRLSECDIERRVGEFIRASFKLDHNRWGALSLDMPAFREGETPLIETISQGLWCDDRLELLHESDSRDSLACRSEVIAPRSYSASRA